MPIDTGSDSDGAQGLERTREAGRSLYQTLNESLVAGLAVLVPILVTLLVLNAATGYLFGTLDLLIVWLEQLGISPEASTLIVRATVVAVFVLLVLAVGFLTRFQYGETAIEYVDYVIQLVPGIGAVYKSFREMGDVMLESEAENFREVKLVEFPHEGSYTMGFLTTRTPGPLQTAAERNDMVTLFLPLAPNPVMGGHLVHVPEDRVMDVDMTVEEGIRTVVTSGVATATPEAGGGGGLSERELKRMSAFTGEPYDPRDSQIDDRGHRPEMDPTDHQQEYERYARPDDAAEDSRPSDVAQRQRDDRIGHDADRPAELEADGEERVEEGEDGATEPEGIGRWMARPTDPEDPEGTIGRDEADPESLARDHDEQLGAGADSPEELAEDREETLGTDAETPQDIDEGTE
jgi:uncharacterized membrane protein